MLKMLYSRFARIIALSLVIAVSCTCFFYADAFASNTDELDLKEYEKLHIAGGFNVDDSKQIDDKFSYFTTVNSNSSIYEDLKNSKILSKNNSEVNLMLNKEIIQMDIPSHTADNIEKKYKVEDLEENVLVNGCANDIGNSYVNTDWYKEALNVGNYAGEGSSVKIELLDSGVAYTSVLDGVKHIDLINKEVPVNQIYEDSNGHGTALAGIIGGTSSELNDDNVTGINPNANIYSVRVLDENLQAPISKIIEGIYWGIENDMDIINMSFGTTVNSEALHKVIKLAKENGILLIASAGNDFEDGVLYPAAYPEVLAVGSTDEMGNIVENTANGEQLDVCAPGTHIITSGPFDTYISGGGTSFSAAAVTGVASLILSKHNISPETMIELLKQTGNTIDSTNAKMVNYKNAISNCENFTNDMSDGKIDSAIVKDDEGVREHDTLDIVNGLWSPDVHQFLVKKANETTPKDTALLNNMLYSAKEADLDEAYHDKNQIYSGLHGLGVYTVNLDVVWQFANLMNKGYDPDLAKDEIYSSLSADKKDKPGDTIRTTAKVLEACSTLIKKETNRGSTNARKKYLVVGFGLHLIGDIYAHRTLVPEYAYVNARDEVSVNNTNYASGSSSDFKSYLCKKDFSNWEKLIEDIKVDKVSFPKLMDDKYRNINVYPSNNRSVYEDNPNFCRERLNASVKASRDFLSMISMKGNTPDVGIIKQQTNVNLSNYNNYMALYGL